MGAQYSLGHFGGHHFGVHGWQDGRSDLQPAEAEPAGGCSQAGGGCWPVVAVSQKLLLPLSGRVRVLVFNFLLQHLFQDRAVAGTEDNLRQHCICFIFMFGVKVSEVFYDPSLVQSYTQRYI